jgi:3-dehydroquinate synthase
MTTTPNANGSLTAQTLTVELGDRSYPIHVGDLGVGDATQLVHLLEPLIAGQQVAIITNETVAPLYLQPVLSALGQRQVDVYQLPDGEAFKTLESYEAVTTFLLNARHNRSTCLVALGGGVVGDLCGFVAATFQRGVDFIQIPTTLLAQVDSSVGGKTAVNHPAGKNMIGAFYQPKAVLADTSVLATLPPREYAAGLAEVVKYGVIDDPEFFAWLENNLEGLLARSPEILQQVILRSCASKAKVVSEDERESGRRAILNYGHTFGHAIEKLAGYGQWLHGEAVSIGMVMAARLSILHCGLAESDAARLESLLDGLGLPTTLGEHDLSVDGMVEAMGMDKKVSDGRLKFVLAQNLGDVVICDDVGLDVLVGVLREQMGLPADNG